MQMRLIDLKQWESLVSRIAEPATAEVIVEFLDTDPTLKGRHAGIYMRARETVLRTRARRAKADKRREWLRRCLDWISRSSRRARGKPRLVWPELLPL
jgi:hypothetical protein